MGQDSVPAEQPEEKKRLIFNYAFCVFVAVLALIGLTLIFVLNGNRDDPVLVLAPIVNYFHANTPPEKVNGTALSGEDSGSRVLPEVTQVDLGPTLTLDLIPQHDNEVNAPDPSSEAGKLAESVRILCCVTTTKETKANAMAVKQTWGNRCNKTIFVSSEEDSDLGSVVLPEAEQGHEFSWGRSQVTLQHLYDKYGNDFDWFLKADDTTYVVVENLRHFLSQGHTTDKPTFFGCQFDTFIHSSAGFVLSRVALKRVVEVGFNDHHICSPSAMGKEDVELLHCLKNLGVELGDSRDEWGRHRFLPYTPERHLIPEQLRKTYWFWQNLYSPHKEGMECCSDTAISFHHVTPYQMIVFHYFVFHLRPLGVSLPRSEVTTPAPPPAEPPTSAPPPAEPPTAAPPKETVEEPSTKVDAEECDLRTIPRHLCHCPKLGPPRSVKGLKNSMCSNEATAAGPHQKVVSYSLFDDGQNRGGDDKRFLPMRQELEASLKETESLYPDWLVRIYTNIELTPGHAACDLICKHPERLFWCDVNRLPELGNKTKMAPRTWRFLPLGDPTVERFITRDLQLELTERERTAVAEWEGLHYPYHTMRDHSEQYTTLRADLWGVKNSLLDPGVGKWMQTVLVRAAETEGLDWMNGDDAILSKSVYDSQRHMLLAHDSYTCLQFKKDGLRLAFPTRREGGAYVGLGRGAGHVTSDVKECPKECRPSFGHSWTHC